MEAKAKRKGEIVPAGALAEETAGQPPAPVRQQPKRDTRAQRRGSTRRPNKKKRK
jgi:hypothetical protein